MSVGTAVGGTAVGGTGVGSSSPPQATKKTAVNNINITNTFAYFFITFSFLHHKELTTRQPKIK